MRPIPFLPFALCVVLTVPAFAESEKDAKPAADQAKSGAEKKPAAAPAVVGWVNDKVTVKATETPLATILDAIAKQSKAQLIGTPPDRKVTADFSELDTNSALERLFGNQNFTLRYDEKGLREIVLKGEHGEALPVAKDEPRREKSAAEYAPPGFWEMSELFAGKTVSLVGTQFETPDKKDERWDVLLQAAYAEADRTKRHPIVRLAMKAFEADEELRKNVMSRLAAMGDEPLAEFVRAYFRDRGKDLLRAMLQVARYPDERIRIRGVLDAIREMDVQKREMPFGRFPKGALH